MSIHEDSPEGGVVSTRAVEIAVALILIAVAGIVMWDSRRLGASWGSDGPEAGYFPFYVGMVLFLASAGNLAAAFRAREKSGDAFVERDQFKLVLQVLVPAIVFVFSIGYLGIYVAAALYIAFFMAWLGHYSAARILPVAVLVPAAFFLLFEIWFLVPLPKGPVEIWFGY
jgi:putative tricarboxylic transport membrane protein